MSTEGKATEIARRRWNRIAPLYDPMQILIEWFGFKKWRELLWGKVTGARVFEVGAGTGNSFDYYPADADISATDFSEKMLKRAEARAKKQKG